MEQKQLDEIDESFFGEEIIDDDPVEKSSKTKKADSNINSEKMADKKNKDKKEKKTSTYEENSEVKIEPVKETKTDSVDIWGEDEDNSSDGLFSKASTWQALTGILVILLIFSVFTNGFHFSGDAITGGATVTLAEAEEKALTYVNSELLQPPFVAELESSEELDDVYRLTITVAGQSIDSFMTKDGKLFFPQGFEMVELGDSTTDDGRGDTLEVSIDDDAVKGNADALVTIVEFSDFECPFCGRYVQDTYPSIVENYIDTGKVKYVFRDFPLSFHANAQKAGEAAECAGEQGMYWEMHDLLFANQNALGIASLKAYADDLGLDTGDIDECLDSGAMADEIAQDMADGQRYGVSGTPAFFINGKLISGAQPFSVFEAEIEAALAEAEGGSDEASLEPVEEDVVVEEEVPAEEESEVKVIGEEEEEEVVVVEEDPVVETGETVTLSLTAKKWMFSPRELTVNAGDNVLLNINADGLDFTFAIPELGVEEEISGTTVVEFTASEGGEFNFECSSCEDWRGMTGTLTVE
ncbi:MAG: thioredoxin domain-containing protein [Nanoarchaeota archaeon]|nr:thioredoxin domain-containing protein [Nanoarchaeota archaeon]